MEAGGGRHEKLEGGGGGGGWGARRAPASAASPGPTGQESRRRCRSDPAPVLNACSRWSLGAMAGKPHRDALDTTVAFLERRDGIDKVPDCILLVRGRKQSASRTACILGRPVPLLFAPRSPRSAGGGLWNATRAVRSQGRQWGAQVPQPPPPPAEPTCSAPSSRPPPADTESHPLHHPAAAIHGAGWAGQRGHQAAAQP